jgi:hypothetical protein
MNVRAIAIVIGALLLAGPGGTHALAQSTAPDGPLRVEWETVARREKAVVRGYVYNDRQMRVERVRLRIEQLDASARPVASRVTWIPGTIAYGTRVYFETGMPAAGATYRVSVEAFDRFGCGDG